MNGPFTPDLYHPISKLKQTATEKGWPLDIKVGKFTPQRAQCEWTFHPRLISSNIKIETNCYREGVAT